MKTHYKMCLFLLWTAIGLVCLAWAQPAGGNTVTVGEAETIAVRPEGRASSWEITTKDHYEIHV